MIQRYLVVEGNADKYILSRLLPEEVTSKCKFVVSNGYNTAISKARSILVSSNLPVSLFVDADMIDSIKVAEKRDFLCQSLNLVADSSRFQVFLFVPEIERVFFSNRCILKQITGSDISNEKWEAAKYNPSQILSELLDTTKSDLSISLDAKLTPVIVEQLQNTDILKEIIDKNI